MKKFSPPNDENLELKGYNSIKDEVEKKSSLRIEVPTLGVKLMPSFLKRTP